MKTHYFLQVLAVTCCILLNSNKGYTQEPLHYWRAPEAMLQSQAALLFEQAHRVLTAHPPSSSASNERQLALFAIDALLHDVRLDNSSAFYNYIEQRYRYVAEKLATEKPNGNEVRIYKVYNHGFIIQSPSVTIGIDIIRGSRTDTPFISEDLIRSVVNQCDILFVSHGHSDHADKSVAQIFCNQNKPVVAPPGLWENLSPQIKQLRGEGCVTERIHIPNRQATLTVKVFPGHQDNMPNNLYAVTTPEGITVMHTGDQYNTGDMEWIARIAEEVKVDAFLVHSWMPEIDKTIEGVKPELIIVGHENEMEHTIDHRESYWLTFRRFKNVKVPYVVMAWGEYYTLSH